MKITFEIFYTTPKPSATLFNARENFTAANYGNPVSVTVEVKDVSADYRERYGDLMVDSKSRRYGLFLADCFKYNFRIVRVDGSEIVRINPFNQSYRTDKEELTIEIEEMLP